MKRRSMSPRRLACATLIAAGLFVAVTAGASAQPNSSQQVVFSGIGFGAGTAGQSPFGFWIWCESASANPYQGLCSGAMYFYAFGITKGVHGTIAGAAGVFTMNVASSDGSVSCSLTNSSPVMKGPRNTVAATCTAPAGFTGASTNAVVNVTGP